MWLLFVQDLSESPFLRQCSFKTNQVLVQITSIFKTTNSGQMTILMVYSSLESSNSSSLMFGQELLVIIWWTSMFCFVRTRGDHGRNLLLHDLPDLLEDVPLMHDCAAAYSSRVVRHIHSSAFHNRWALWRIRCISAYSRKL